MYKRFTLVSILVLLSLGLAQPPANFTTIREQLRPMIDLSGAVFLLIELEQETELTLNNPQIEQLLPILYELQNRESFTSEEVEKILVSRHKSFDM